MKSTVLLGSVVVVAASLPAAAGEAKPFGKTAEGVVIEQYVLTNANGMRLKLITLGATIAELHVPDKHGKLVDVVLGFDDVAGYESDANQYFGCTTGRYANRIAKGKFT
ncbi:MAG: galactose-1-epimerase, partial [Gemmataceae bacterium]|nr:galactose-1-epimerase [Gemmataceae bacterium]